MRLSRHTSKTTAKIRLNSPCHRQECIYHSRPRDQVVLASKFTFNMGQYNPNAGGNGRKNILRAVEGSLKRLDTDYLDIYYLHTWDQLTPAEEVMRTLDAASQPETPFPYYFFTNAMQGMLYGGASVGDKPAGYRAPVLVSGSGAGVQ